MNAPGERKLQVGHGVFDPLTGDLFLEGRTVRLRPRTAALLAYLVQHAERPVGKDELMQKLWPEVVVTEDSIVQCVKEIRQALGDGGREWIRTLPRTGYAFVGNPVPAPASQERFRFERRWWWAAAIVLATGLAGAVAWRLRPAPPPQLPSGVVLPIVNETGDAGQDRTADDLTEAITDKLGRGRGGIIAPSTARTFKDKPVDVRALGEQLKVRYVLQGTLRMDDDRPVLRLRLADAPSSVQLWQQDFKFNPGIPELRPEIVGGILAQLTEQFIRAEARRSSNPDQVQAADLYGRANDVIRSGANLADKYAEAIVLLEQAVRLNEDLGAAWATLAAVYLFDVRFTPARVERLARAAHAIERARKIIPSTEDAIIGWQAAVYLEQGRTAEALNLSERALDLNLGNAMAMIVRAQALRIMGRPKDALAQVEKALRTSPRDPALPLMHVEAGLAHLDLAGDAAAAEALRRAVNGAPKHPVVLLHAAGVLGAVGHIDEARADMAQLLQLRPGFTLTRLRANEPSQAATFVAGRQRFYDGLRRAGLPE